jgi:hypothetical protein
MNKIIERIKQNVRDGDRKMWEVALDVAFLVGEYDEGVIAEISNAVCRSRATIYRWARAGRMRTRLCVWHSKNEIGDLSPVINLAPSYFDAVGAVYENTLMTEGDVFEVLSMTVEERWTVETLRSNLPDVGTPRTFAFHAGRIAKDLDKNIINAPALFADEKLYKSAREAAINLKDILERMI